MPGGSENDPEGGVKPSAGADSGQGGAESPEGEGLSGGEIAGIVVGSAAGALLIAYGIIAVLYKKKLIAGAVLRKLYPFIK